MPRGIIKRFLYQAAASRPHLPAREIVLFCAFAASASAHAYTQDAQLERELGRSEPDALAMFPAKGYIDGIAGFFRIHRLYVVPGTQRAWCTDKPHGVLKPGCYVEFSIQGAGQRARDAHGVACGHPGRWYREPGSARYIPTPGPFISKAIANGEWKQVEVAIYDEPLAERLPVRTCGAVDDGPARGRSIPTRIK
jgi:hypothetical protein